MSQSNNRASLLSGLRTGGVRSASGPIIPHTAAPGGSFNIPRFASGPHPPAIYEDASASDGLDFGGQTLQYSGFNHYGAPMTAGFNDRAPRFHQHQHQQEHFFRQAQLAMGINPVDQAQLLQMQMMQAMVSRDPAVTGTAFPLTSPLQAQQQQLQAQIAMQQQVALNIAAQHQQQQAKPVAAVNHLPATAGPTQTSFDIRSNAIAQLRSSRLSSIDDIDEHGPFPMTAALGGKFGSRSLPSGLNPGATSFKLSTEPDFNAPPPTPSSTVVISGGTTIGGLSTPTAQTAPAAPSKSDAAVSWRRGSTTTSSTIGRLSPPKHGLPTPPSPPRVAVSGPAEEFRRSTPPNSSAKYRPQPLRIAGNSSPQISAVSVEQEGDAPASPTSSNGSHSTAGGPKKYEGVGMGRPQVGGAAVNQGFVRVSQPVRQPRGPPAGAEDLGSKNFASRIKSRASIAGPLVRPASGFVVEAY
jgi:hypothetical protein